MRRGGGVERAVAGAVCATLLCAMERALRVAAVFAAALVLCAPAVAMTDGPVQLPFTWPAEGTITGRFGEWRGSHVHPGIDIGTLRSLTVRAATGGRVTAVGTPLGYEGYGNVVIVRTGAVEALYAHLATARVRRGERVAAGEPLGVAGCTGWCTGTHLHFELRYRNVAVDPTFLMVG